jgi:hypothetical protein
LAAGKRAGGEGLGAPPGEPCGELIEVPVACDGDRLGGVVGDVEVVGGPPAGERDVAGLAGEGGGA